jgi:DNA-binding NarL/FixJ family response regulator
MQLFVFCSNTIFTIGLEVLIKRHKRQTQIYTSSSILHFLDGMAQSHPDTIIVDAHFAPFLFNEFLTRYPLEGTQIFVVDTFDSPENHSHFFQWGAAGVFSTHITEENLLQMLTKASQPQQLFFSNGQCLLYPPKRFCFVFRLSKREQEVLGLLLEGKSVSEIGYAFDRKINTVTTIKNNLYKKMGVTNFVELMYAYQYFDYFIVKKATATQERPVIC